MPGNPDRQTVFFDSPLLRRLTDQSTVKSLGRCGSYVWKVAKNSLKYQKVRASTRQEGRVRRQGRESAPAGSPPHVYASPRFQTEKVNRKTGVRSRKDGSPLRELMRFEYDILRRTMVVGPEDFRGSATKGYKVPRVQEEGGTVTIRRRGKPVRARIGKHAYMVPAMVKSAPKFPGAFKGSFKK